MTLKRSQLGKAANYNRRVNCLAGRKLSKGKPIIFKLAPSSKTRTVVYYGKKFCAHL